MRAFASVSLCVAFFFFWTWEGRDGGDREEKAEGANVSESVVSHFSHLFFGSPHVFGFIIGAQLLRRLLEM